MGLANYQYHKEKKIVPVLIPISFKTCQKEAVKSKLDSFKTCQQEAGKSGGCSRTQSTQTCLAEIKILIVYIDV